MAPQCRGRARHPYTTLVPLLDMLHIHHCRTVRVRCHHARNRRSNATERFVRAVKEDFRRNRRSQLRSKRQPSAAINRTWLHSHACTYFLLSLSLSLSLSPSLSARQPCCTEQQAASHMSTARAATGLQETTKGAGTARASTFHTGTSQSRYFCVHSARRCTRASIIQEMLSQYCERNAAEVQCSQNRHQVMSMHRAQIASS